MSLEIGSKIVRNSKYSAVNCAQTFKKNGNSIKTGDMSATLTHRNHMDCVQRAYLYLLVKELSNR